VKQNVAFTDARVRSLDENFFVRELHLVDFSRTMELPDLFEFDEVVFNDNGLGYDERERDGIYTSAQKFEHTENVTYQGQGVSKSVLKSCLADPGFLYREELMNYMESSENMLSAQKIKVKFDCDVYICNCNTCKCISCGWPIFLPPNIFIGVVRHCFKMMNCHIEFDLN
jgi:hypothetical protein